jgi:hypothetical protein
MSLRPLLEYVAVIWVSPGLAAAGLANANVMRRPPLSCTTAGAKDAGAAGAAAASAPRPPPPPRRSPRGSYLEGKEER